MWLGYRFIAHKNLKSQICQIVLGKEMHKHTATEILCTLAEELKDGSVSMDKATMYKRRDELIMEAKQNSEHDQACD